MRRRVVASQRNGAWRAGAAYWMPLSTVAQPLPGSAVESAAKAVVVSISVNRMPPCGWPALGQQTSGRGSMTDTALPSLHESTRMPIVR